jgi:hypothetical protein
MTTSLPEELLFEILKRLLPTPQVLARASAVCREWRRVLNNSGFLRELYRARRGAPVTLGFFHNFDDLDLARRFVQMDPGDPVRIASGSISRNYSHFMDCRHGRVLLHGGWYQFVVWHPMTGDHYLIGWPDLIMEGKQISAALICDCTPTSGDGNGEEGGHAPCQASHFRVAVLFNHPQTGCLHGSVFSSLTGMWSYSAELPLAHQIRPEPSALVGKTLYVPLSNYLVLAFDTDQLSTTTFERPDYGNVCLLETDDSVLGLAGLRGMTVRLWARNDDAWVMQKTVDLSEILPSPFPKIDPQFTYMSRMKVIGVADGGNTLFLWTMTGVFMLCVESLVLNKVYEATHDTKTIYPYGDFYLPPATRAQKLQLGLVPAHVRYVPGAYSEPV